MSKTDSKPTPENEQTQAPGTPLTYAIPYTQKLEDDTIDLYGLCITLWDKKFLVIAVTAISALGSVVYALLQPSVYKAEALLLPPKVKDIQSLNVQGVQETSSEIVFEAFKKNLISRSLQKKFIEVQDLMDFLAPNRTPETRDIDILESFAEMIKIKNGEGLSVSMESDDPSFAAKLVNDYISFFDIETISELSNVVRNSILSKVRDIEIIISSKQQMEKVRREDQIKELEESISSKQQMEKVRREDQIRELEEKIYSLRETAKIKREDQIKLYEEAAVIASNLGFRDGVDTANILDNDQSNITTNPVPLYYRGFRALRAEIEFLKNRKSDDPFIIGLRTLQQELTQLRSRKLVAPFIFGLRDLQVKLDQLRSRKQDDSQIIGLRNLQEKLARLRSIKIEEEGLHAVSIDQAAYPPRSRIKPNRRRIAMIGTVAGLFFGICLAFFVAYIQKQKEIHSE